MIVTNVLLFCIDPIYLYYLQTVIFTGARYCKMFCLAKLDGDHVANGQLNNLITELLAWYQKCAVMNTIKFSL